MTSLGSGSSGNALLVQTESATILVDCGVGVRKMTAALEAAGHPVSYYENIEGGHGGAADNSQAAFRSALIYRYLWKTLGG